MRKINYSLILVFTLLNINLFGQERQLLLSMDIQIEATAAVDALYDFDFKKADKEFRWLRYKYPNHPMPYFLLGFAEWWKILPHKERKDLDKKFIAYMDSTIMFSEKRLKKNEEDMDAIFFLSASYGFLARIYSDRKDYRKATFAGKNALKYIEMGKKYEDMSPEFKFGDGMIKYFTEYIKDNYFFLRPVLMFFPDGDKKEGMKLLQDASKNAFYTRIESKYWQMYIYTNEDKDTKKALKIAEYLHTKFPNNAYFARYYANLSFERGMFKETERVSMQLLKGIEEEKEGYEAQSGRRASYFLGYINYRKHKNNEEAINHFKRCIKFSEELKFTKKAYYRYSHYYLAKIYAEAENIDIAKRYYKKFLKHSKKKKGEKVAEAKNYIRRNKKS